MSNLPKIFKALIIHGEEDVRYEDTSYDFNNLDKDHLVIKIIAAGLGPYDLRFASGKMDYQEFGKTFGVEGCDIVVKVGSNCDSALLGKRVGLLGNTRDPLSLLSLSEYSVINQDATFPLPDKIDDYQGAYLLSNPTTAFTMYESLIKNHKAIVQDVASSALGKMITKLAKKNNIKIINIVRKEENLKILKDLKRD
jgi:NADPH:quinone reductase-like Zn-dependent oxidoreductase